MKATLCYTPAEEAAAGVGAGAGQPRPRARGRGAGGPAPAGLVRVGTTTQRRSQGGRLEMVSNSRT